MSARDVRIESDQALDAEYSIVRDADGVMVTFGRRGLSRDGAVALAYTLRAYAGGQG